MDETDRLLIRSAWWLSLAAFLGVAGTVLLLLRAPGGEGARREAVQPAVQRVEVRMKEFKFEPARVEVQAGRVELVLRNDGVIPHDFAIPALGVKTEYIAVKKEKVVVLEVKPGTYPFECTVGGHKQAGMHGTLVVR
ncbi:MAG: cupredoxin domain-containing protein [Armatimonadota bacterium]|nr:cupredoxin domain-containing protein [Armatimonadota bacterium]MDR7410191.1 cupredoxin domain-containing protein [Armatimonadota bacterium]